MCRGASQAIRTWPQDPAGLLSPGALGPGSPSPHSSEMVRSHHSDWARLYVMAGGGQAGPRGRWERDLGCDPGVGPGSGPSLLSPRAVPGLS